MRLSFRESLLCLGTTLEVLQWRYCPLSDSCAALQCLLAPGYFEKSTMTDHLYLYVLNLLPEGLVVVFLYRGHEEYPSTHNHAPYYL